MFGTSANGDTVSSLTGQESSSIMQIGELGGIGGRVRCTLMFVCREQMVMLVHLSSYGLDFTKVEKVSWLYWKVP